MVQTAPTNALANLEGNAQMLLRLSALLPAIGLTVLLIGCGSTSNTSTTNAVPQNSGSPGAATSSAPTPANATPGAKLNLNTATESQLMATIPGFGKKMAHEFDEYRPYRSIQQFRKEMGKYVGPEVIADYEKYVFVPINPNESDAATLQQIPGLDATEAESLIAGRPYASAQAFLAKLADKISASDLGVARTLLGIS
jgi:DNA uptake protein ComE-like DNA-binding protein